MNIEDLTNGMPLHRQPEDVSRRIRG